MSGRLLAFLRHDALTASSYRVRLLLSLSGLVIGAIPLYFVANALQPVMSSKIEGQGSQYFSFVLVGLAAHLFVTATSVTLPKAIQDSIRSGTLEALFATPTRVSVILAGLMVFKFVWAIVQAMVLIIAGLLFGATFSASGILPALLLVLVIAVSYAPFGLIAAALHLSFRTAGPLSVIVSSGSALLGGVYYPTDVIPSWIAHVSAVVPLTYGVRALRKTLLEGSGVTSILGDVVTMLMLFSALLAVGSFAFWKALQYSRRTGSLAHY
jgi:ABC-2 type transport system permease protein